MTDLEDFSNLQHVIKTTGQISADIKLWLRLI